MFGRSRHAWRRCNLPLLRNVPAGLRTRLSVTFAPAERALVRRLREHILVGLPASEAVRDSWREPDACGIEFLKEPHRIAPADKRAGDTRGPASRQLCERLASIPEATLLRSTSPCRCGVAFERLWTSVFRRDR